VENLVEQLRRPKLAMLRLARRIASSAHGLNGVHAARTAMVVPGSGKSSFSRMLKELASVQVLGPQIVWSIRPAICTGVSSQWEQRL